MNKLFNFKVGYRNNQTVFCLITDDIRRLRQTIQLLFGRSPNLSKISRGKVFAASFRYPKQPPLIWMPRLPKTKREHGSLAHEASHAAVSLAVAKNGRFQEELLARTIGHIVFQILVRE